MRLYFEIALRSFRRATTYRSTYIAGILTNAFFGAVRCWVYLALYDQRGVVAGFSVRDALTYTWLTQSMISIGGGWLSGEISQTIRTGEVAIDLARPWSFYAYWLSRTGGERLCNLMIRGTLTYLIGFLYFDIAVPSLALSAIFTLSLVLSVLASFAFGFMVNLSAFWLTDATGLLLIANITMQFFSGFLIPLVYFPSSLAVVARVLPFQAITGLPAEIWLGKHAGRDIIGVLLLQTVWVVTLMGAALVVEGAAIRKVVIQGG